MIKETKEVVPPTETADYLNSHLCNVAARLTDKFGPETPFNQTVTHATNSFHHTPISIATTLSHIRAMKIYKSSGIDKLSSRLLKESLEALAGQLTYLFNKSLEASKFPSKWKIANVVLIHKGGDSCEANNYRPISLLPVPGKMLEKIVHDRLYEHLEQNDTLTDAQWGFRKNRSTTLATTKLVESI